MADWLERFVPMRLHVLVRFGLWEEIIAEPLPKDRGLYCFTTALTHYTKGLAHAASSQVEEAERERENFSVALAHVPETRYLFNNQACVGRRIPRTRLRGGSRRASSALGKTASAFRRGSGAGHVSDRTHGQLPQATATRRPTGRRR